jgi:hypothetical protein
MLHAYAILTILTCLLAGGCASHQARPAASIGDTHFASASSNLTVTVICKPTHYLVGWFGDDSQQLIKTADTNLLWDVYGIVLQILDPPPYAGQVLTMHHDGVLGSGDPFRWWVLGQKYEFKVERKNIGRFDFGMCSYVWPCKTIAP